MYARLILHAVLLASFVSLVIFLHGNQLENIGRKLLQIEDTNGEKVMTSEQDFNFWIVEDEIAPKSQSLRGFPPEIKARRSSVRPHTTPVGSPTFQPMLRSKSFRFEGQKQPGSPSSQPAWTFESLIFEDQQVSGPGSPSSQPVWTVESIQISDHSE